MMLTRPISMRCFSLAALATVASLMISAPVAFAQSIVATVNGTPITSAEVSERSKFTQLTTRKTPGNKQTLEQLVEEIIIIQEAGKRRLSVSDEEINGRYNAIAQNVKLSPSELSKALQQAGASDRTFKQNIRSQMLYRKLITSQFNIAGAVSEKDVALKVQELKKQGEKSYRYTLRQIIFVLPKNASAAQVNQRRAQAQNLRANFKSCDNGIAQAHKMRDVAVKAPVYRTSAQFGAGFYEQVKKMNVGQATQPDRNEFGIEIVAICDKVEIRDDSLIRNKAQMDLAESTLKDKADNYVKTLREKAVVVYR